MPTPPAADRQAEAGTAGGALPAKAVADLALPVNGGPDDYVPLLDAIGDARVVLLGEGSHGTHEFYRERRRITRMLVERLGFQAVAVEADWPDAYRVNRYVRGVSSDPDPDRALSGFRRFPTWMWRNREVVRLVEWLRDHNRGIAAQEHRVGFYGLDLYSLRASIEAVVAYLETIDPEAAGRARTRYACFDHYGDDAQDYGHAAWFGLGPGCQDEVVEQLREMQQRAGELAAMDGRLPPDEHFFAERNAVLVRNAERYYRTMYRGREDAWNLRDTHMADTLESLVGHLGDGARVVVWEHNSHIGDARATEMARRGELNVGQLVRERYGDASFLVGFTTHSGTVTAARDWGQAARRYNVRPSLENSWERLFHESRRGDFLLRLRDPRVRSALPDSLLERAIGVIYRPETERLSHYFHARIAGQFDAVIHLDHTRAVEPLEPTAAWDGGEVLETYPTGI